MPTTLGKTMRSKIVMLAVAEAHKAQEAAYAERRKNLMEALYDTLFQGNERARVEAIPPKFLRHDDNFMVNLAGNPVRVDLSSFRPVPCPDGRFHLSLAPGSALGVALEDLRKDRAFLDEQQKAAKATLRSFVFQFNTVEQLNEAWPEGRDIVRRAVDGDETAGKVYPLVVQREDVNKALGLEEV